MKNKYIPISIIAKRLNVTVQAVRDAIHCGEIKGTNRGLGRSLPRWYVTEESYQNFIGKRDNTK